MIITIINEDKLLEYSKKLFSDLFEGERVIDALPRRSVYTLDRDTEIVAYPMESMGAATFCMVRSKYLDRIISIEDTPGLTSTRPTIMMGIGHIKRHSDIGRMSSANRMVWGDILVRVWDSNEISSNLQIPSDSSNEWYMDVSLEHEAISKSGFCMITASSNHTYEQLLSERTT